MEDIHKLIKKFAIAEIFTPSAPIDKVALFAGRTIQITKLINAVSQRGQHALLFGERGVGKTSLANVLKEFLERLKMPLSLASTNCEASSTFGGIWRILLNQIPIEYREAGMGFDPATHVTTGTATDFLSHITGPEDIRQILEKSQTKLIFVIDEIDRLRDPAAKTALADTIKTLSDHSTSSTLIMVGVADSVDQLIGEHLSIERALVQIRMPRMSLTELMEIITKGLADPSIGMTASPRCKQRIARLSHGLPHYTHSLALHAAQAAVDRDSLEVKADDVTAALEAAIENAQQSIISSYHQATSSPRGNLYSEVLLACALAETDDLGYFPTANLRKPMSEIMGKPYDIPAFSQHLKDFCEVDRGAILERTGYPRRYRFRFVNPLMEPYVVMKGVAKSLINPEALDTLAA